MRRIVRAWILIVGVSLSSASLGQQALENFGKNRIQYKFFKWSFVSSDNFEVYFYDNRRNVAQEAVTFLEGEFDRITDLIGYQPYFKTKVFLYNSITDQQQSNIGLNHMPFTSGGETEFVKPYIEVAHPGTLQELKDELLLRITQLMIDEMMFGGSLRDMFQNAVLLNLPDWFSGGASLYAARGWSPDMDDYVRQLIKSKSANKILKLEGTEAELFGQSMWNFIAERYGRRSVSNILNYTRIIRNEQKAVLITLGLPFRQLMQEWRLFYGQHDQRVQENYVGVEDATRVSEPHRTSTVFTMVKLSPDGKKLAYAENDRGRFRVLVKSLESGRETTVLQGGNRAFRQRVDLRVPILSWADANTLGVITIRKGNYVFWLYDMQTRSKLPRELDQYSNIRSLNFSSNGRLAVLSADRNGQNDLYLISSRRDRTRQLTNDVFDDLDPTFLPNSNTVIFSSNRSSDTLANTRQPLRKLTNNYNLFSYDLDTTRTLVGRITNTVSKDYNPLALDEKNIFYLSDQRGIVNLFRYNIENGIYTQVTNFNSSIKEYDINFYERKLALVMTNKLREDIFVQKDFNFERQVFTPPTRAREMQLAKTIIERKKPEAQANNLSIKDLINARLREKQDSARLKRVIPADSARQKPDTLTAKPKTKPGEINTDDYRFEDAPVRPAPGKPDTLKPIVTVPPKTTINTEDYVFEDDATRASKPSDTFLNRYLKAREPGRVVGPFRYEPRFSYENLVTSFVVDALRGFSFRTEVQMNDMLENYRFLGGLQSAFDFRSGDVYAEFQYLPLPIDLSVRFDRRVIMWETQSPTQSFFETELQKYTWQKLEIGLSVPISVRTRFTLKPFMGYTRAVDRGFADPTANPVGSTFLRPTQTQFYSGTRAEIVYDNSLVTGMNLIEGTRAKIGFVTYRASNDPSRSFSQISADVRHYQKIYKEIVLAGRGFVGSFFGNAPKNYMLGGMDNWIANRFNYEGENNPLTNRPGTFNEGILFHEFATSLRGFSYATLYGTNVMLANVELRVPLVRALSSGPITSNFFRNMQLTAFYDIGTSWTGELPFGSGNSVRQRIVPAGETGSPFRVEINEFLNPWLSSYGFGFRSMMLGYYLKFDLAWPIENYTVRDPRFYVTLGFDF